MGTIHYTRIYARKGSEEKIFASVKEATEFVKGRADRVYKCCQGILQSHRGWRFSYTPFEPMDKDEEWRDIEGYGGRYQISNKELREILSQYPDDAMVAVEYCNINELRYHRDRNLITID